MTGILVWAELRDGRPTGVTLELLNKATDLASMQDGAVSAVVIGQEGCRGCAAELIAHGAGRVFVVEDPRLGLYQADVFTTILCRVIAEARPGVVLLGATAIGADLAPSVAARLGTGLTAHCTDLHLEDIDGRRQLVMVVPGWRGSMMVKIVCPERRPVMATVRPGVLEKGTPDPARNGAVVIVPADIREADFRARTLEMVREAEEGGLEQAAVIVSGGFGFYEAGGISLLERLARAVGGVTAGSRPACDAGWIPESRMIGQSGKTVSPKLFISIGASGAPHYTTGFTSASLIVAIDKNPKAPIFDIADFGIVGDLRDIIPALAEVLEAERQSAFSRQRNE
ncbi:MAG: electron transfer flavoprotein subunit alpha/FixB family protein [Syntrophaceae bacterium]|nr:electron transfer flavoprotein subunit alpha/FixB family protein [Syntrophaceae bacterium]